MIHAHARSSRAAARACCPACAASAPRRGPLRVVRIPGGPPAHRETGIAPLRSASFLWRERGPARRAWIVLLVVLVGMVPLAAMSAGGDAPSLALASPTPLPTPKAPPALPPIAVSTDESVTQELSYDGAVAHGTPNAGSLEDGVLLPLAGRGFYTYDPSTQEQPGSPDRRWGTGRLVREMVDLGRWWSATHPEAPRLGIGDLSLRNGGRFADGAHVSHQNGLDVDIRLPRTDGVEAGAHPGNYDRDLTQAIVDHLVSRGASLVLIGPSLDISGPGGVVVRWPNHDDHLHVRFPGP